MAGGSMCRCGEYAGVVAVVDLREYLCGACWEHFYWWVDDHPRAAFAAWPGRLGGELP